MRYNHGEITDKAFYDIVDHVRKDIKRVTFLDANIPIVYGGVRSNSGISDWYFQIDFNDNGKITGNYEVKTDNDDSPIPYQIANRISKAIQEYYIEMYGGEEQNTDQQEIYEDEEQYEQSTKSINKYEVIFFFGITGIIIAAMFSMLFFSNSELKRHEQKLQNTVDEIMVDIEDGDFTAARIKANSLYWDDSWSSGGEEKWNAIREEVIAQIDKAEKQADLFSTDDKVKYFLYKWLNIISKGA